MAKLTIESKISDLQQFVKDVYLPQDDKFFETNEMLINIQRFGMRGLKGIRKGDKEKIKKNLIVSLSWFISTLNRLHIDLEQETWKRYPYRCSYCAEAPCECKAQKIKKRKTIQPDETKKPKNIAGFQKMLREIYPPERRSLEHAGVHFAEEVGEFAEAFLAYHGTHNEKEFDCLKLEAADYFSNMLDVFNSMNEDLAKSLAAMYSDGCHVCHGTPCNCSYDYIKQYK